MTEYGLLAGELFEDGYNCAQSVAGAFAKASGTPLEVVVRAASSFGGGIAGRREMCGAVSGMIMAIGLMRGDYDRHAQEKKQEHYALCRKAMEKFEERLGTLICSVRLEKNKSGENEVNTCREICEIAADIVAEILG